MSSKDPIGDLFESNANRDDGVMSANEIRNIQVQPTVPTFNLIGNLGWAWGQRHSGSPK